MTKLGFVTLDQATKLAPAFVKAMHKDTLDFKYYEVKKPKRGMELLILQSPVGNEKSAKQFVLGGKLKGNVFKVVKISSVGKDFEGEPSLRVTDGVMSWCITGAGSMVALKPAA